MVECTDCEVHEGTVIFASAGTIMALRGWGEIPICQCCYVERIKKALEGTKEHYETQLKKLNKDGCK